MDSQSAGGDMSPFKKAIGPAIRKHRLAEPCQDTSHDTRHARVQSVGIEAGKESS